jgi:putative ABC transport system substrate-binding protein
LRAAPDVILANGGQAARAVQRATRTVPVIFIGGGDPVAAGYVQSLARPGGNMTGFTVIEQSLGPKMLELLEEIVPRVSRVAIMFNPDNPDLRQAFDAPAAAKNAVKVVATPVPEPAEINAAITGLGDEPNPGLIVLPDPATNSQKLIVELAARYHLPAIHAVHAAAADGGLMS